MKQHFENQISDFLSDLGDRVQLVEEEHAGRGSTSLVEELAHVGLGLTEPHCEQLGTLDADEVGLALVGNGLGEQGLTAARRSVEQHALGGSHAELEELLWVLDGVLHKLLQLALDTLETANVLPGHVGHLDDSLAEGGGVGSAKGKAEVVHGDGEEIEHLGINLLLLEVDEVHALTDLLERSLGAEGGNVGTNVTVGLVGNLQAVQGKKS